MLHWARWINIVFFRKKIPLYSAVPDGIAVKVSYCKA